MTRLPLALACAALVAAASPASAGDFGAGVEAGFFQMSASQSAKAVFGSPGSFTAGAALEGGLGHSLFVRLGARYVQRNGERVFVADPGSPVFDLGHPLKMRLVPLYALVGYRFLPTHPVVPYVGAGFGVTLYHEHSDVAGLANDDNETKAAGHFVGGLEYRKGHLRFGVEAMYQIVPNALGLGGVSAVYGERDLGGFSVVGRVLFH